MAFLLPGVLLSVLPVAFSLCVLGGVASSWPHWVSVASHP